MIFFAIFFLSHNSRIPNIELKVFLFHFLSQNDTNQRLNLDLKQGKGNINYYLWEYIMVLFFILLVIQENA